MTLKTTVMDTINTERRKKQAEYIGINDIQGNPIREGDILKAKSGFRHVVIWNPYINGFFHVLHSLL